MNLSVNLNQAALSNEHEQNSVHVLKEENKASKKTKASKK